MSSLLSLRHYSHKRLSHSHDRAQLVFGISGQLDVEINGQGRLITRQTLAVVPSTARVAPARKARLAPPSRAILALTQGSCATTVNRPTAHASLTTKSVIPKTDNTAR